MAKFYNAYEDNAPRPEVGQIVSFEVKVPSATQGMLFDYNGKGRYLSESANGFYIEVIECSEPERVGTKVSVRQCRAD